MKFDIALVTTNAKAQILVVFNNLQRATFFCEFFLIILCDYVRVNFANGRNI
jgi:hypothetical protein